jgi:uncharacterized protein (DUF1499 family)
MRRIIIEEPYSDSALWSRRLALFAAAVVGMGLVLARAGLDPTAVLAVIGSAIIIACLAMLCAGAAIVAIWRTGRKGVGILMTGSIVALLLLAYPTFLAVQAIRLPALNDVSTDLDDPPAFSLSHRAMAARNDFVPPSVPASVRQLQAKAYPDVQPILLDLDGDEAFAIVLRAAVARHWTIIESIPPGGRLGLGHVDAIAHGMVFGFADDIAIRVRPLAGQTRVDVRSVSRIGRHDFGANARRIEAFADELNAEADADTK